MLAVLRWLVVAVGSSALVASAAAAQRIPCPEVVHEMNRLRSAGSPRAADPEQLAHRLNTSPLWVEKCASIYGRRLKTSVMDGDERVRHEEKWESEEPTEVGREELEAKGDRLTRVDRRLDRARQRELNYFKRTWEPVEHNPWEPNLGHEWTPYLIDEQREPRVERVPGQVTD